MSNCKEFNGDFSVGVDIESISRFKKLERGKDKNFLNKIFTEKEQEYCFSKKNPAQHLAVRFAAKEATIKAMGSLGEKTFTLNAIEIINGKDGTPLVNMENYVVKISLSHCEDKAIAFVIVSKK